MGQLYVCGLSSLRDHLSPGAGSFDRGLEPDCAMCQMSSGPLHTSLSPHYTIKIPHF